MSSCYTAEFKYRWKKKIKETRRKNYGVHTVCHLIKYSNTNSNENIDIVV